MMRRFRPGDPEEPLARGSTPSEREFVGAYRGGPPCMTEEALKKVVANSRLVNFRTQLAIGLYLTRKARLSEDERRAAQRAIEDVIARTVAKRLKAAEERSEAETSTETEAVAAAITAIAEVAMAAATAIAETAEIELDTTQEKAARLSALMESLVKGIDEVVAEGVANALNDSSK